MKIEDIMTTKIQCCNSNTSLDEIASKMWEFSCGAIPVVDQYSKPIGMITDRDIAMSCTINHKAPWEIEAMTVLGNRNIYSCSQDEDLDNALNVMKENRIRRLPVTDEDGRLVGLLSIDDVVACSKNSKQAKDISYENTINTLKAVSLQY